MFRAPSLLLFLGLGVVVGDDGLAIVQFDDYVLAQRIAVVALVVILFEGGLSTSLSEMRRMAAPALLLATVGVMVTAGVLSLVVIGLTDIPTETAVLLAVVVASTDAAAVFAVMRHTPAPRRLTSLVETESGANDPMAVLLTVGVLAAWEGDPTAADWLVFGLRQMVGGLVIGLLVGRLGALVMGRLRLESSALYPVLAVGLAGVAYGAGAAAGCSGFLAVYVAGLVLAASSPRHRRSIRRFHEGLASVSQIALFTLLGLLVFPSELPSVAGSALIAVIGLTFVARPLAVALCLPWFGFDRREYLFASWAGLRGAVPVVLATFPLAAGHPDGALVFNIVFFVVLMSAAVQGLTIAPLARRLGLGAGHATWDAVADLTSIDDVGIDVVEVEINESSAVADRPLHEVPLPGSARVAAVLRDDGITVPNGATLIRAGDLLVVVAPSGETLAAELTAWAEGPHPDADQPPELA
ncbi:MAG: potassium/proton antiporter [Acidimicrobiia bacterium]|nr:potassium/proton antiporter [Acidimicrobiia bacterium]